MPIRSMLCLLVESLSGSMLFLLIDFVNASMKPGSILKQDGEVSQNRSNSNKVETRRSQVVNGLL